MENKTGKTIWITFKIWMFAVLFNAIGGSIALGGLVLFPIGFIYGLICSFPVFTLLSIILLVLVSQKASSAVCLITLSFVGLGSAIIALRLFLGEQGMSSSDDAGLYAAVLLAAFLSVITQISSIRRLTDYSNPVEELFENSEL